jgi:hypothetical protein
MTRFFLLAALALSSLLQAQPMKGIYASMAAPQSEEEAKQLLALLRSNPDLTGVLVNAPWETLEPEREKYDYSALERTIKVVREAGKQYKLNISAGMRSPLYIYADGAARLRTSVSNPSRSTYGNEVSVPVPWDPVYQKHFSRLIRKLGERYASDPHCVGVTLTCANFMSSEMHLPRTPKDMEQWKKFGLTSNRLLAVYKKYMDEWAAAFPRQFVCLHKSLSAPMPDTSQDEFAGQIALYGIERHPKQFALQHNILHGRKETEVRPDDPIFKYKDRLLHGYQSFASFLTTPQRQGTIEMAVLNFVRADAMYWEVWRGDGVDAKTCAHIAASVAEARKLGAAAYKQKLIRDGLYRTADQDDWAEIRDRLKAEKDAKKTAPR